MGKAPQLGARLTGIKLSSVLWRWLVMCIAVLSGGCTVLPHKQTPSVVRPAMVESAPFSLNGRVLISYRGERHSAGVHWSHHPQTDEVLLLAPLGQIVARIMRDAQQATLDQGNQHFQAEDVESLMKQALGWYLPLDYLHHWILGVADTATSAEIERDLQGRIILIHQENWEIRYLDYADNLPSRLQLNHDDLQIKLLIDEWDWNP